MGPVFSEPISMFSKFHSDLTDLSYCCRCDQGDQASIVGGAINYVKELEHKLHFLGGEKQTNQKFEAGTSSLPFDEFFAFPQYSTSTTTPCESSGDPISANADIEVTVVESHANLKIRTRKRPKQLMKMVSGLQSLRLTVLHLNVSTVDQTVLYSLSVKVSSISFSNIYFLFFIL